MYGMKKLLNIFSALLLFNLCVASVCLAQSDTHNYVVKDVMQDADGKVLKHTVVDYMADKEVFRRVTTNNYDVATGILVSADVSTFMDGANAGDRRIAKYDVRDWPWELSSPNFTEQLSYTSGCYNGKVHKIRYTGSARMVCQRCSCLMVAMPTSRGQPLLGIIIQDITIVKF